MSARAATAALVMWVCLPACGEENTLTGSIDQLLSLDFEKVEISKDQSVLVVDYLKSKDGLEEIVARVTLETEGLKLKNGMSVRGDDFMSRVRLQRATRDNAQFPQIESGKLDLDEIEFKSGGNVRGEFNASFVDGKLLLGTFEGKIGGD